MPTEESLRKFNALKRARPPAPLPLLPKIILSRAFKERFPEDAATIEQWNQDLERFFKELPYSRV